MPHGCFIRCLYRFRFGDNFFTCRRHGMPWSWTEMRQGVVQGVASERETIHSSFAWRMISPGSTHGWCRILQNVRPQRRHCAPVQPCFRTAMLAALGWMLRDALVVFGLLLTAIFLFSAMACLACQWLPCRIAGDFVGNGGGGA